MNGLLLLKILKDIKYAKILFVLLAFVFFAVLLAFVFFAILINRIYLYYI
jgi:hypothetical protein